MPFIPVTPNRKAIDKNGLKSCKSVGDLCYYHYRQMMDEWNKEPRWTTAHIIYVAMVNEQGSRDISLDGKIAYQLAWQVFFQLHVMPYEHKKRAENGDIV